VGKPQARQLQTPPDLLAQNLPSRFKKVFYLIVSNNL
jgi:hypothetical protein